MLPPGGRSPTQGRQGGPVHLVVTSSAPWIFRHLQQECIIVCPWDKSLFPGQAVFVPLTKQFVPGTNICQRDEQLLQMCAGSKHLLIYNCLTVSRHFGIYFIGTDLVRSGLLHDNCELIYLRAFSFSQKTRMRSGTNFKQMCFFMASLNGYMNLVGFLFSYTKEMRNVACLHRTMWFFPRRHWIGGERGAKY